MTEDVRKRARTFQMMARARERLRLDTKDLRILCEAGSNNYRFASLQAALGGAEKVYAVTKDSLFGRAADIQRDVEGLAECLGVRQSITFLEELTEDVVADCDVVLNSGHVRPITSKVAGWMKRTAVIPLMWETWEFRPGEVDLDACRRRNILVMGTNEHHHLLDLFRSNFFLVAKLCFDCGLDLYKDRILLCGGGPVGVSIAEYLAATHCEFHWLTGGKEVGGSHDERIISAGEAMECAGDYDAVVVAEMAFGVTFIASDGLLDPGSLAEKNEHLQIIHIAGKVDEKEIIEAGLSLYPRPVASQGYMTVSPDYLGPRTVIELVTAGLSVGATMARYRLSGHSVRESERLTLQENPLAMNFSKDVGENLREKKTV